MKSRITLVRALCGVGSVGLFNASSLALVGAIAGLVSAPASGVARKPAPRADAVATDINISGPFLQNLTRDGHATGASWRCGEGQLTQDVRNRDTLVMSCMSLNLNYQTPITDPFFPMDEGSKPLKIHNPCYTFISRDGGNTWKPILPEPLAHPFNNVCFDPLAEQGPNGELYLGRDALRFPADEKTGQFPPVDYHPFSFGGILFTRSLDGGKTWSKTTTVPTAVNRPMWTVDQSTGFIYEVSGCNDVKATGNYGCTAGSRNLTVSTDRGQTWSPTMDIFSTLPPTRTLTPGRLHDISFPGGGSAVAAANGVFATAGFNARANDATRESGLLGAVESATFKYSTDQGATFTEHSIPLAADKASCAAPTISGLAADPTHHGGFAVLVSCTPAQKLRVYVTRDLGSSWTRVGDLSAPPPQSYYLDADGRGPDGYPYKLKPNNFVINRPWMAYGPTGALGVVWRQSYGASVPGRNVTGPQDVFVALSSDGTRFGGPIRLNTAASPPADPRQFGGQDLSHIVLDSRFAYAVWDDWRSGEMQVWFRKVPLPRR